MFREGVPFTLSHVMLNGGNQCYNYVAPYPNLEINSMGDRESIINAVDIYTGRNRVFWVLDTGIVNTLEEEPRRECEAKVLGIDFGNKRVSFQIIGLWRVSKDILVLIRLRI